MRKPMKLRKPSASTKPNTKTISRKVTSKRNTVFEKARNASKPQTGKTLSGEAGFARGRSEQKRYNERRARGNIPFRLWLKPGEERKYIILDDQPTFFYEHNWQGASGKFDQYARCIQDTNESCPLCKELGKEGYYVMMLTVLDINTYTDKQGKRHTASRKLLPVKTGMQPKFQRKVYDKYNKSMRGVRVIATRDGDKDANIGNDIETEGKMSEAQLNAFAKKHKLKPEELQPIDYAKAFPVDDAKTIAKRHSIDSSAAGDSEFDNDDDDDSEDSGW